MADSPPQKRVLPARERRESAAKRRASSPPPPPKAPTPKKPAPSTKGTPKSVPTRKYEKRKSTTLEQTPSRHASTPLVEEMLPTKIHDSKPLPVSRQAQPQNLSIEDFRSVAESAVLAATLHRSRMQWLCDGVFDKYWTAPYKKKKGVPEPELPPNNPDKKSMHKLGSVTITIEPHTFDAVIYTVHDLDAPPVYYRQSNQYPQHPPPGYSPYYGPPAPNLQAARPSQPSAGSPPVQRPPSAKSTPKTPGPVPAPAAAAAPTSQSTPKQGADPVIQMLASRAAADPELKNLMKIVASSKATQDQLKHFQSHIDELNEIIRRQQAEKAQPEQSTRQVRTPTPTPAIPQTDGAVESTIPSRSNTPIHPAAPTPPPSQPQYAPYQPPPHGTYPPYSGPPPPHYRPPPPPKPRAEPRVKHIVLEFTTPASGSSPASQDRWLFPEFAVLDTPIECRGLQMLASFFVIRKGSDALAQLDDEDTGRAKWKPDVEYFQPVTMTLRSAATRILETIARAAKPLPEVQAKMKEILESKKRAPVEYPVWRLPKDGKAAGVGRGVDKEDVEMANAEPVDSGVDMGGPEYDDELKEFYGT